MGIPSIRIDDVDYIIIGGVTSVEVREQGTTVKHVIIDANGEHDATDEELRALEAARALLGSADWTKDQIAERRQQIVDAGFSESQVPRALYGDGFLQGAKRGYETGYRQAVTEFTHVFQALGPDQWALLSDLQREVAIRVGNGKSHRETATEMFCTVANVRYHLRAAALALGLTQRQLSERLASK